jgi:hypothetical protein
MLQKITFILLLSVNFSLLSFSAIADVNKIVKWVDSNGVTHYGDKLPSQEAGRNNIEMRNNGVVIKQNIRADKKTETLDQQKEQEKLAQVRADTVLLASYTNPEEIDLACERNLQTDYAALQFLTQNKQNAMNRVTRNKKTAQDFQAKDKLLPASLTEELKQSQLELGNIHKQIAQRKQNIEATRKRYAEEKKRFIALKQSSLNPSELARSDSLIAR